MSGMRTPTKTVKTKIYDALPEGLVLGTNVRYYKNGWKIGLLDKWEKGLAKIIPIGGYKGGLRNHITVHGSDIEPIEVIGGSC